MATTSTGRGISHSRLAMWALALALGAVLAYVVYSYIGTFVLGLFIYYITRPIHRRIADRIPTSTLAAAVSLTVLALPLILLLGYTVYVGAFQLAAFAQNQDLAVVNNALQPLLSSFGGASGGGVPSLSAIAENPQQFVSGSATDTAQRVLVSAAGYLSVLGNAFIQLFIVLAIAFYLLRDDHYISAWFTNQLTGEDTPAHTYFVTVDRDLKTVFFGNILNAFAVAILAAVSYVVLNLFAPAQVPIPSPVLVGLLVGVGSLVPVVGMKIVYVPIALVLAVEAVLASASLLWFPVAFVAVSLLIVDTIPDFLLRPYVSGRDMHTGAVMIAYIVGPLLFGWYGLFLGPLLLVAMIHFARIILPELARGEPLTSRSTTDTPLDPSDRDEQEEESEPVDVEKRTDDGPDTDADSGTASNAESDRSDRKAVSNAPSRSSPDADRGSDPDPSSGSDPDSSQSVAHERESSADRVRSTWDEESSTTDGGTPRDGESGRRRESGASDESD